MIDPSENAHVPMLIPQYRDSSSGESEDTFRSDLRDLVDSQLPHLLPDDPSGSFSSSRSGHAAPVSNGNGQPSGHDRRKRSHKKDRHSSSVAAQREMVRLLVNEEGEAKSVRGYLRIAMERLDNETRRAQEAERRALEIAERFRLVNESRLTAQAELTRVSEELKLWQNQYQNAQKEILRGHEIFRDLESQRNVAESDATRYRTLARKLNEERLVNNAREEGRREGYEEGLKRGMEQGRRDGYNRGRTDIRREAEEAAEAEDSEDEDDVLDGRAPGSIVSESIPPLDIPTRVPLNNLSLRGGTQFHENFTPASTATRSLAAMPETTENDTARMVRPPLVTHNRPPSGHHPDTAVPPDNLIPEYDAQNNRISLPPPHEFITRTGSPYSDNPPLPVPDPTVVANFVQVLPIENVMKDFAYQKTRSSPPSISDSIQSSHQSTNVSQYEIVGVANNPGVIRVQRKGGVDPRQQPLDRIDEVSSSMEYSPGPEKKAVPMPVPVTFPLASGSGDSDWGGESSHGTRSRKTSYQSLGTGTPRTRMTSQGQRQPDDARYSSSGQRPPDDTRYSNSNQRQPEDQRHSNSSRQPDDPRYSGSSQRQPNDTRYSNTNVEDWRQKAVPPMFPAPAPSSKPVLPPSGLRHEISAGSSLYEQARPRSVTTPRPRSPVGPRSSTPVNNSLNVPPHRRSHSLNTTPHSNRTSGEFSIYVESPSGPGSISSPVVAGNDLDLLSPNHAPQPLPSHADPQQVPTAPNTPTMRRQPSIGMTGPPPSVSVLPAGFIPMSIPTPASTTTSLNAPPIQQAKTHPGGIPGGSTWTMKGVPERTTSAQGRPRPQTPQMTYEAAPMPQGIQYPTPPFPRPRDGPHLPAAALDSMSPRSNSSRLSPGHQRSLSLNAGATPAMAGRSLSAVPAPKLRKMPSSESVGSNLSGKSRASASVPHFDPRNYVDIAALASSEDLLANMQSPTTAANTKANAGLRNAGGGGLRVPMDAGPSMPVPSPAPPPAKGKPGRKRR